MIHHMDPTVVWTEDSIEERRKAEAQSSADILTGFLAWIAIAALVMGLISWR